MFQDTPNDIDCSEGCAYIDIDIVDLIMFGQHKTTLASIQEENVCDIILILIDILTLCDQQRFQQRTYPCFELIASVNEEGDIFESLLVEIKHHLHHEVMWKLLDELVEIIDVLFVVVL